LWAKNQPQRVTVATAQQCALPCRGQASLEPRTIPRPSSSTSRAEARAGFLTPYLMLFTGDTLAQPVRRRRSLAVEPTTCAPDAFRSGDGLWTLAPGESSRVRGHSRRLTAGAATAAHSSHHDRNSVVLSSSRPGISSPSAGFRARENAIKTRRIPRWRDPDSNRGHRVSVGRTSRSNWAKSPVIRRVSVGSPGKAEASFLRTLSLRWVPRSVFRYPIEADGCDLAR